MLQDVGAVAQIDGLLVDVDVRVFCAMTGISSQNGVPHSGQTCAMVINRPAYALVNRRLYQQIINDDGRIIGAGGLGSRRPVHLIAIVQTGNAGDESFGHQPIQAPIGNDGLRNGRGAIAFIRIHERMMMALQIALGTTKTIFVEQWIEANEARHRPPIARFPFDVKTLGIIPLGQETRTRSPRCSGADDAFLLIGNVLKSLRVAVGKPFIEQHRWRCSTRFDDSDHSLNLLLVHLRTRFVQTANVHQYRASRPTSTFPNVFSSREFVRKNRPTQDSTLATPAHRDSLPSSSKCDIHRRLSRAFCFFQDFSRRVPKPIDERRRITQIHHRSPDSIDDRPC